MPAQNETRVKEGREVLPQFIRNKVYFAAIPFIAGIAPALFQLRPGVKRNVANQNLAPAHSSCYTASGGMIPSVHLSDGAGNRFPQ